MAQQLLTCCGRRRVDYRLFRWEKFDGRGKTIVLGGGGGLVPYYDFTAQFIARFASQAKHLIILPHSVSGHEEFAVPAGCECDTDLPGADFI